MTAIPTDTTERIHAQLTELYPICRSITGNGVRESLRILGRGLSMEIHEAASGTRVFDWTVPEEWNLAAAWIRGPGGDRIVDSRDSNLHVVSYSVPISRRLSLAQLRDHLHGLPDRPELVPYRTSYYNRTWGFCLPQRVLAALPEGDYEVRVDATLQPGHLTWGECFLPGEEDGEILVSTHVCHPSLANDNLSGMVVCAELVRRLAARRRRLGCRFLFIPGTIGSITWLARNEGRVGRIRHGLVAAGLGGPGHFWYKRSRRGDATVDRVVERVLAASGAPYSVEEFVPFGYDERQFCSPGFDLPVGSLTRTPWGRYPEYHTSADDLRFVRPEQLIGAVELYLDVLAALDAEPAGPDPPAAETRDAAEGPRFLNLYPRCEPQLGRRGLYRTLGGGEEGRARELALLWMLNLSDGRWGLDGIARRSGLAPALLAEAADSLLAAGLLAPAP